MKRLWRSKASRKRRVTGLHTVIRYFLNWKSFWCRLRDESLSDLGRFRFVRRMQRPFLRLRSMSVLETGDDSSGLVYLLRDDKRSSSLEWRQWWWQDIVQSLEGLWSGVRSGWPYESERLVAEFVCAGGVINFPEMQSTTFSEAVACRCSSRFAVKRSAVIYRFVRPLTNDAIGTINKFVEITLSLFSQSRFCCQYEQRHVCWASPVSFLSGANLILYDSWRFKPQSELLFVRSRMHHTGRRLGSALWGSQFLCPLLFNGMIDLRGGKFFECFLAYDKIFDLRFWFRCCRSFVVSFAITII